MHVSSGLLDRHTLESPEKGTLTDGPPLDFLWANQQDVFLVNGGCGRVLIFIEGG